MRLKARGRPSLEPPVRHDPSNPKIDEVTATMLELRLRLILTISPFDGTPDPCRSGGTEMVTRRR